MCFSATASFTLSGVLAGVGAASIARSGSRSTRLFAAIPLLFAAQQAVEGVVWLTITDPPSLDWVHRCAVMSFLALALVVWPLWAPLSLRLLEPSATCRKILTVFFLVGVLVAAVAGRLLLRWQPIATIAGHSIHYIHATMGISVPEYALLLVYAIPTTGSFFVSTRTMVPKIGATLFISLILAFLIQHNALTSVWCFFAAALSAQIYMAVGKMNPSPAVLQRLPAMQA